MNDTRQRLRAKHTALLQAIEGRGETPGIDPARIKLQRRSLARKHAGEFARLLPSVRRCLGSEFMPLATEWCLNQPMGGDTLRDALAWVRTIDSRRLDRCAAKAVAFHQSKVRRVRFVCVCYGQSRTLWCVGGRWTMDVPRLNFFRRQNNIDASKNKPTINARNLRGAS